MTEQTTQTTVESNGSPKLSGDEALRAEMSSFLKEHMSGDVIEEKSKTDDKVLESDDNAESEKTASPSDEDGVAAKAKDEEDGEEADESDSGKEAVGDKKKISRYQRLKTRAERAEAEARTKAEEAHQALEIANQWRLRAKQLEQMQQSFEEHAREHGVTADPRDRAIAELRANLEEQRLREEMRQKRIQEAVEHQKRQKVSAMTEQFTEQASALSAKYGNVSPKKILQAYASRIETGDDATMEDVAAFLSGIDARRKALSQSEKVQKQITLNSQAPRSMKPAAAPQVDYPATKDGMRSFLKANGFL